MALPEHPDTADQPNLFDPADPAWDDPVPFTLTARGRRVVDEATPRLRVVEDRATPGGATGREAHGITGGRREGSSGRAMAVVVGSGPAPAMPAVDPRADDRRLLDDLEDTDTWRHARVRAMARAGRGVADIATEMDLSPTVVRVWLADPAVAAEVRAPGADGGSPSASAAPDDGPARSSTETSGLAVLAAIGVVEVGAVVATTTRITVADLLVTWLRAHHGVTPGQVRVVLQVAEPRTGDLVARAWADRLDLTPDRVTTVGWRGAPTPRAVQATVRISGRDLALELGRRLDAWPGGAEA